MERQPQYQGTERRHSQAPYEGDERRKAEPMSAQENTDGQQDRQEARPRDDTQ